MLLSIAKINLLHIRQHILTFKKIRINENLSNMTENKFFYKFLKLSYRAPARLLHEQQKKSRENIAGYCQ